jgi:hypothetical protein
MAEVEPRSVDLVAAEQLLLAQIGLAAVRHWHELPPEQRAAIRNQAIVTQIGDEISVQMAEQIDAVIHRYSVAV